MSSGEISVTLGWFVCPTVSMMTTNKAGKDSIEEGGFRRGVGEFVCGLRPHKKVGCMYGNHSKSSSLDLSCLSNLSYFLQDSIPYENILLWDKVNKICRENLLYLCHSIR